MSTSTSESLPCTAAADFTRSSENDPPTTDMEIAIEAGTQVDVGNGELDASTTSSRRTYSREKKLQVLKFYYENRCNRLHIM